MATAERAPQWYPDPTARYEYRWWDGTQWTPKAASAGQEIHDPLQPVQDQSLPSQPDQTESTQAANNATAQHSPASVAEPRITTFNAKKVAGQLQAENTDLRARLTAAEATLQRLGAVEAAEIAQETKRARAHLAGLTQQMEVAEQNLAQVHSQLVADRERVTLETDFGIYDYEHPAEVSAELSTQLASVRSQIKALNSAGTATHATTHLTFEGSSAKGRTFVNQISRIMLRWYNAEAESAVKSVKAGKLESAQKRLNKLQEQVQRQGRMINLTISPEYHLLRLQELELAARHLQVVAVEKERERERRAELREQKRVEAELAKEKERLTKERAHYQNALDRLLATGDTDEARDLEERLAQIDEDIAQADYRAANIRAGYVYVVSNIGAFGDGVVKIGMTRRLDPMDRVRELGDASVPFTFDVHALFFSQDAVDIEAMLHREFSPERINKVNPRKEFFRVSPQRVLDALKEHQVSVLEFQLEADAEQYRASMSSPHSLDR